MTLAALNARDLTARAAHALEDGTAAEALPVLTAWCAAHRTDTGVHHWLALLLRALDRRDEALAVVAQARSVDPASAGLAQLQAQIALEAGIPAVDRFLDAIRLAPGNAELRLGLATARFEDGGGARALDELGAMLAANPGWYEGHRAYAQLCALLGRRGGAYAMLDRALALHPTSANLHHLKLALLQDSEDYLAARPALEAARAGIGHDASLDLIDATLCDEAGDHRLAGSKFAALGPVGDPIHAMRLARHQLRLAQPDLAAQTIEPWLAEEGQDFVWPYAALAWRMLGDRRSTWLEDERLIAVVDLDPARAGGSDLAALLRRLHARAGRFLDQSVRGGTQTAGPLLARIEPPIAALREACRAAVADHIASLSQRVEAHPTLRHRRDRAPRFAGSWSVRLAGAGFHSSHHHPQGWFSSAYYVSVPESLAGESGHLVLGEGPADLGTGVGPLRVVAPRPGRLVIFPSWLWHATRPFDGGERMTVAFDIMRP